jgi:hypothetical protein
MNPKAPGRSIDRRPRTATVAGERTPFAPGEPVWVMEAGGGQRRAEYLGARVLSVWRGGPPMVFVVYADSHVAEAVEVDRVIPRRSAA